MLFALSLYTFPGVILILSRASEAGGGRGTIASCQYCESFAGMMLVAASSSL